MSMILGEPSQERAAGEDEDQLRLTGEYLRLITPNLSAIHIDEAKAAANRFKRQSKEKQLEKLNR